MHFHSTLLLLIYIRYIHCSSQLFYSIDKSLQLYYGSAQDVCLNKESSFILIGSKEMIPLYNQFTDYYTGSWFWFEVRLREEFPENAAYYPDEEGIWLVNKLNFPQIFHFFDNFYSLYKLSNCSLVPPVNTLITPNYYPPSDYDYSYLTYKFLTHNYKPKFKEINAFDFGKYFRKTKSDYICFHNVNLVFRVRFECFGCFFKNSKERIEFRDSVFDYLKIKEYENREFDIRIGFIRRNQSKSRTRNIINGEMIIKYLKSCNYQVDIVSFELFNPIEQIRMFQKYNIVISAMGSGLLNMLWLGKNVVIIQCFNYFYIHFDFAFEALNYGFSHIALYSSKRLYSKEHYDFIKDCYDTPYTFSNTRLFLLTCDAFNNMAFDDLYINLKEIVFSVELGIKFIKNKYSRL